MSPVKSAILAAAAVAALTTSARAGTVTSDTFAMVCGTPGGVTDASNAIMNKPANLTVDAVIAPLNCIVVRGGLTFIVTDDTGYTSAIGGILVTTSGEKMPVFINRSGIVQK